MKNIKLTLKNQKLELGNVSDVRIENVTVNGDSFSSPTQK